MERMRATFWLFALTAPLLAGCVGDDAGPAAVTQSVGAMELVAGTPYLFHHTGGDLRFAIEEGEAVVTLFAPDDHRVGQIQLGEVHFRTDLLIEGAMAGDYVVVPDALENTTLQILSGDGPVVRFFPLGSHFERHILFQNGMPSDPLSDLFGGPALNTNGESVDTSVDLQLEKAPLGMRILFAGSLDELTVDVHSDRGVLFHAEGGFASTQSSRLGAIGGQFETRNVHDGAMTAQVRANGFQGALILESWSFSRFQADTRPASIATEEVAFTYGELPARPALFRVHDKADALYLWTSTDPHGSGNGTTSDTSSQTEGPDQNDSEEDAVAAYVALYAPDDHKIGTYRLLPGEPLRVPVETGGEYVAVLKQGVAFLGADRVPVDFEVRVLDVVEEDFPPEPAGTEDEYAIILGNSASQGVPFGLRPVMIAGDGGNILEDPSPAFGVCSDEGTLRFVQDGETLGFWGSTVPNELADVDLYLGTGQVTFVQDGLGGTCGHSGFTLSSYVR